MQASTPTPGATGVTTLPPAGRDEMLVQCGLRGSAHWSEADRRPHHADDAADVDVTEAYCDADFDGSAAAQRSLEALGFLTDGGWTAVDTTRGTARDTGFTPGARDAGMTSHRGVLHPDEYVDNAELRLLVEAAFGFTFDQVRSVYRQGRLSDEARALRSAIDARLLGVADAGGNVAALGRVFGFHVNESGACAALNNALARARGVAA